MKLSELFKTPFKVKGGGVLNLRGFSKTVVDKEIEGGGGGSGSDVRFPVGEKILNLMDKDLIAHPSKFAVDPETTDTIIDISQIDSLSEESQQLYFLYKKSDIDAASQSKNIIHCISYNNTSLGYEPGQIEYLSKKTYTIDNVLYYALYMGEI